MHPRDGLAAFERGAFRNVEDEGLSAALGAQRELHLKISVGPRRHRVRLVRSLGLPQDDLAQLFDRGHHVGSRSALVSYPWLAVLSERVATGRNQHAEKNLGASAPLPTAIMRGFPESESESENGSVSRVLSTDETANGATQTVIERCRGCVKLKRHKAVR